MRYGKDSAAASALDVEEEVAEELMVGDIGVAAEVAEPCEDPYLGSFCRRS